MHTHLGLVFIDLRAEGCEHCHHLVQNLVLSSDQLQQRSMFIVGRLHTQTNTIDLSTYSTAQYYNKLKIAQRILSSVHYNTQQTYHNASVLKQLPLTTYFHSQKLFSKGDHLNNTCRAMGSRVKSQASPIRSSKAPSVAFN